MKNTVKNFGQFINESKREKLSINGFEWWLDRDVLMIFDKEDSVNGVSIHSKHITPNEKKQIMDFINYVS